MRDHRAFQPEAAEHPAEHDPDHGQEEGRGQDGGGHAERNEQRPESAHACGGPKTTLSRTSRVNPGFTISDPNRAASNSDGRATASCSPARSVNRISPGPSATRPSTDFFKSTRTGFLPSRSP